MSATVVRRATVAAVLGTLLVACGGNETSSPSVTDDSAEPAGSTASDDDPELSGELIVFAAASLTDAFDEIGAAFQDQHPDVTVTFNYAGSSTLATQIVEGSPADVFASANDTQMDVVVEAGEVEDPTTFATNQLEIVVEAGNPLGIEGLEDLARDDVVLVLAAPEVPAGDIAAQMLEAEGIEVTPSSLEVDVRATLGRVELGEADAALVYRSDVVTASDAVEGVEIPDERNVIATYPLATTTGTTNPDAAAAFVEFVLSDAGQQLLGAAGFTSP